MTFKKLILIIIPLVIIGSHITQRVKTWYYVKKEIKEIRENINRLEKDNKQLVMKKDYYQTEEYIRRQAREKLGLVDKNDFIFVLPELPDLENNKIEEKEKESPVWKQWWDVFFI